MVRLREDCCRNECHLSLTSLSTESTIPVQRPQSLRTVLVLLDIQQNHVTHASLLEVLSKQYDVVCLEMNNQSADSETFHWTPTLFSLQQELKRIASELNSVSLCVAQGFAATLVHYLPVQRAGDILCNPTLATKDIRLVKL